ncbi:MAG: transcriptional regulator [Bacteroidota bacterium]|nr:transcriptional regulator [Bacteroidota bacterium]
MINKIINTKEEYQKALSRLNEVFLAKKGTPDYEEAEFLEIIIKDYENKNFHFDVLNPIEVIKIRMEEMNLKQKDLVNIIGTKSMVSDILNRKRALTLKMIRQLNVFLDIPVKILIQEYSLNEKDTAEKI